TIRETLVEPQLLKPTNTEIKKEPIEGTSNSVAFQKESFSDIVTEKMVSLKDPKISQDHLAKFPIAITPDGKRERIMYHKEKVYIANVEYSLEELRAQLPRYKYSVTSNNSKTNNVSSD